MAGLLSGLWKGLFGSRQDELNEQATEESIFQMKHPFARTMQDAQQYGINPITALGSQPSQATFSGSSADSNAGQLLNMIPAIVQSSTSRSNTKDSNETQKDIAGTNNETQKVIASGNNETAKTVATTNANASKYVADKNAEAAANLRDAQTAQANAQALLINGQIKHREEYGYQPDAPAGVNALSVAHRANEKSQEKLSSIYVPFLPSMRVLSSLSTYDSYLDWTKRLRENGQHGKNLTEEEFYDYKDRMYRKNK